MGWNVRRRPHDCLNLHGGAISGFRAMAWFDMEDNWAGFVSVNNSFQPAHSAISAFFRQIRKQEEQRDWIVHFDRIKAEQSVNNRKAFGHQRLDSSIASSSWELDDFVGTYWHKGFGRLHIERRPDH